MQNSLLGWVTVQSCLFRYQCRSFIIRNSWDTQSFIVHHSSFVILHSSFIIHHPSSFIIHHSSFSIHHSAFTIDHSAFIIRHSSFINQSTIDQKSIINRSKIDRKSSRNLPKSVLEPPGAVLEASRKRLGGKSWLIFESILKVRRVLAPFWSPKRSQKRLKIDLKNYIIFSASWNRFFHEF